MKQLGFGLMIMVLASACSSSSDSSSGDSDAGDSSGSAVGDLLGSFSIQLVAPRSETDGSVTPGYTAILGKVYDGIQPETVIWDAARSESGCVLATPRVPFCSPGCGASAACVADNTCQTYPAAQSVGTVHVTGVAASTGSSFDLTAVANTYQPAASTTLVYPGFGEGDAIKMTASGSSFASAFSLAAQGVAALAIAGADGLALAAGQPLQLSWAVPGAGTSSQVHVALDISHHGGSRGKITCDVADAGSLAITAAMVDQLLALGAAGYPSIVITRSTTGHAAVATGHVDLVVASQVEAPIAVPGVQSCTTDDQCTPPATCQDDLTCK